MGNINEENYEIFFLDYLEGNLSPELVEELMVFLEAHPHLKDELDDEEMMNLSPPKIKCPNQEELLKGQLPNLINKDNYSTYFIAAFEGDLTRRELDLVDQFIDVNGPKVGHYRDYKFTKLIPDLSIRYQEKIGLLRTKTKVLSMYHYGMGVAASLMFFALIQFSYSGDPGSNNVVSSDFIERSKLRSELRLTYAKNIVPASKKNVSYISNGSVETNASDDEIIRRIGNTRNKQFADGSSFDSVLMFEEAPAEKYMEVASKEGYLQTPASAISKNSILRYDPKVFEPDNFYRDNHAKNKSFVNDLKTLRSNAKSMVSKMFGVNEEDLDGMVKTENKEHGSLPGTKQNILKKALSKVSKMTSDISGKGVQFRASTDKEGAEYNVKLGKFGVEFKRRKN